MSRHFQKMLEDRWAEGKFVCVGLDSELGKIPESAIVRRADNSVDIVRSIVEFNSRIIDATHDIVCCFKPNLAFYAAHGADGLIALRITVSMCHMSAPSVPVILDAKYADIGNTNLGYVQNTFEYCNADGVTLNPYLGRVALQPFLDKKDKGLFMLARTSNEGAGEFQDLFVDSRSAYGVQCRLYLRVAENVMFDWNVNRNCGLVVGATCPDELRDVRATVRDVPLLIPGIGAQGGDLEKTIAAGKDSRGKGMIINSSRGVIFASNGVGFADAARSEVERMNKVIHTCF